MFDNWNLRSSNSQPGVDIYQIIREAQTRWLRPVEVIEILRNHHIFRLNPVPPNKPPSGSLFLFDRKTLRFFRKDGHNWRKKKDGKTVREAHERLKAGSVDILHCYYAHGEDNVNFQRRSYWMLEGAYEHIVLVHYREVKEGSRTSVRTLSDVKETSISAIERDNSQSAMLTHSPISEAPPIVQNLSSPETSEVEVTGPYQSMESVADSALREVEEIDSGDEVEEGLAPALVVSGEQRSSLLQQLSVPGENDKLANLDMTSVSVPLNVENVMQSNTGFSRLPNIVSSNASFDSQRGFGGNHGREELFNLNLGNTKSVQLEDDLKNTASVPGQSSLPFATLDISGWNMLLENFRDTGSKQDLKSPCWADLLEQIMTPPTSISGFNVSTLRKSDSSMQRDDANYKPAVFPVAKAEVGTPSTSQAWRSMTSDQLFQGGFQDEQYTMPKEMHSFDQQSDSMFTELGQRQDYSQERNQNESLQVPQQEQSFMFDGRWASQLGRAIPQSALPQVMEEVEQWKHSDLDPLKKLDSFGRWMSHEIGQDADSSLISGSRDLPTYWASALDGQGPGESNLSFSQQMQMDTGLNPSLAHEQKLSISDYSPEWAFSSGGSKVVVVGTFLECERGGSFSDYSWACMFGEVEVPAEVIQSGVLRCIAPPHEAGRVPFYVTCRDRFACSEIREFEYRTQRSTDIEASSGGSGPTKFISQDKQSNSFLVRFAKMLSLEPEQRFSLHDVQSKINVDTFHKICRLTSSSAEEWKYLHTSAKDSTASYSDMKEQVLQIFLKERLQDWLLSAQKEGRDVRAFDDGGQGVLHLAAALGYDWAVAPILAAGIGVNFRDLHGWTALHWASSFGREKVLLALLAAGAAPGPVTDPTSCYPSGRTPADLAATSGHGGMAGYLAEMSLTTHLSSLALKERNMNEIETFSAALAEEKAVDYLSERTDLQQNLGGADEQVSLQESLRAVRNAARAAALIQATFRRHSFRKRQDSLEVEVLDDYTMSPEEVKAMVSAQKTKKAFPAHRKEMLHAAAVQIQCKFRSWKGRKDFLNLRQRVVKIQAHFRGHQVRKKFRKLLWSVGILEKAVLRWRRKGVGLRGFRAELTSGADAQDGNSSDGDDVLKAGRKEKEVAIRDAVTRVQSMVNSDQARAQYRRLLEGYRQATSGEDSGLMGDASSNHRDPSRGSEDDAMFGEM